MKKLLLAFLFAMTGHVNAQSMANAHVITMIDPTISFYVTKLMYEPASNGLYFYDISSKNPSFVTMGTGISVSSGALHFDPTSGQVTTALGYTPYNATNPSGYRTQAQVRGDISLTTTGSGAASYNNSTGVLNVPTPAAPTKTINNSPGRSLVSVAAAANGWQVSSTKDAVVRYSVTITTAVQIGIVTNVEGYMVLEVCQTNSSTAGDWVEIGRTPQAQNVGLAIALSSTQKGGGQVSGDVPAGWYTRARTVNVAGTPTYTLNSQQESY